MGKPVYLDIDMDYFVKPVFKSSVNGIRLYRDEKCLTDDIDTFFEKILRKINIPEEKHIFTNHKKAYIYWWIRKLKDCTLVHVDAHSDLYRNKQGDLRIIRDKDMNCDDYLWYALRDDFIDEIYWVCPEETECLRDMDSAMKVVGPRMVKNMNFMDKRADIDFEIINWAGIRKNIKLHILTIDDLPNFEENADMLTMATSPEFIPSAADMLIDKIDSYLLFSPENIEYVKKMHERMLSVSEDEIRNAKELLKKDAI